MYFCGEITTMIGVNTYIQQISYDGLSYTKGTMVDPLSAFHIIAKEFPFVKNPESKELPTRDWAGADGLDIYVPPTLPMKHYSLDVTFLYTRRRNTQVTEAVIRQEISSFIDFLYGRKKGSPSDTVQSARLAVFNEYTGIGRKDVVVSSISNEVFFLSANDDDFVAEFNVKFMVYDPTTEVTKSGNNLVWS